MSSSTMVAEKGWSAGRRYMSGSLYLSMSWMIRRVMDRRGLSRRIFIGVLSKRGMRMETEGGTREKLTQMVQEGKELAGSAGCLGVDAHQ